jgi:hypothetical protein
MIIGKEKQQFMEMGYACTAQDQAGILILVNTRESAHEKGLPHAHLQAMDTTDIAHFFITKEIPQKNDDLRFVEGTFAEIIPVKYKKALVDWAKSPTKKYPTVLGWEFLKDEWERLRPTGKTPKPYPSKDRLKNIG